MCGVQEMLLLWLGERVCAPDCISLLHTSPAGEMTGRSVVLSVPINEMYYLSCCFNIWMKPGVVKLECEVIHIYLETQVRLYYYCCPLSSLLIIPVVKKRKGIKFSLLDSSKMGHQSGY